MNYLNKFALIGSLFLFFTPDNIVVVRKGELHWVETEENN